MNNGIFQCQKCGKTITSSERFCGKCGTPNIYFSGDQVNSSFSNDLNLLNNNQQPVPILYPNNSNSVNANNIKDSKFDWLSILPIVLALISWFAFWWLSMVGLSLGISLLTNFKKKSHKGLDFILTVIGVSICGGLLLFVFYAQLMR